MALDLHRHEPAGAPTGRPRRPSAPGPGAGRPRALRPASMLNARIVIAAVLVLGQLWALTVATIALESKRERVSWFVAFEALSFAAAFGLWISARPERG